MLCSLQKEGRQEGSWLDAEERVQMHGRVWAEKTDPHQKKKEREKARKHTSTLV